MNLILFIGLFFVISLISMLRLKSMGLLDVAFYSSLVKFCLCIMGLFVTLPFGGADALVFEGTSWAWAQRGFWGALQTIDVSKSYVFSTIIAIFYSLLGRDISIPIFINGIIGVLIFYYSMILADEVWGVRKINKVFAFIVALHPMLNVHSAIILRENYVSIFIILASIHLAKFANKGHTASVPMFFIFTLLSSFFHGGMILFAAALPLYVLLFSQNIKISLKIILGGVFTAAFFAIMTFMEFGKLSDIQEGALSVDYLAAKEMRRPEANTAYLVGLEPTGIHDLIWQAPVRIFFLLAKPFPWDVRSGGHLIVMFDALIWWTIMFLIFRNWNTIRSNPAAMAILIGSLLTILAFSYGTGNFGTGVRHRTKFIVLGLVLVAPFFPRVILFNRNR